MFSTRSRWAFVVAVAMAGVSAARARGAEPPFEDLLSRGEFTQAERVLDVALKADPKDDRSRFALGIVQFLHAVERRMQAFHRYGYRIDSGGALAATNLPIRPNPKPESLDYKTARALLQEWIDDLARVEATLGGITSADVKLPLRFGLIRLDFDGDAVAGEDETLWKIYANFNRQANVTAEAAQAFVIAFDRGDVDWLRGYCHVLSALTEILLTYDFEDVFNHTAYLLFRGAKAPETFLEERADQKEDFVGQILDLAATVHLIRLPASEPARLTSALAHLESMVALSRSSWAFIKAESDDDREWIPKPGQHSVVPNVEVTPEMVEGWGHVMDELESILKGKTLAPFWRGQDRSRGINVRKVFTEPRVFDLVLWIQGTGVSPYLERGHVTSAETWSRINRIFRGEFIGFALWFN